MATPSEKTQANIPPDNGLNFAKLVMGNKPLNKPTTLEIRPLTVKKKFMKVKKLSKKSWKRHLHHKEMQCLKLNLYHEARGETDHGIIEVMRIVKARVASPKFPNTICKVVWQWNQFEWTNDGKSDKVHDLKAWRRITKLVNKNYYKLKYNPEMLYYHSGVLPRWFKKARLIMVKVVGNHKFYRERR